MFFCVALLSRMKLGETGCVSRAHRLLRMDLTDSHGSRHPLFQSSAGEPWEAPAVALPAKICKSIGLEVAYILPRLLGPLYSFTEAVVHSNSKGCSVFKEQMVKCNLNKCNQPIKTSLSSEHPFSLEKLK